MNSPKRGEDQTDALASRSKRPWKCAWDTESGEAGYVERKKKHRSVAAAVDRQPQWLWCAYNPNALRFVTRREVIIGKGELGNPRESKRGPYIPRQALTAETRFAQPTGERDGRDRRVSFESSLFLR